ncbi:hypothetical protein OCA08_03105 [Bacillus cereus]|nr:hypothetical protein [Bacillus cereus]
MKKIYTGFEAIERMKTHWISPVSGNKGAYKFNEGRVWMKAGDLAGPCNIAINSLFEEDFSDYEEPIKVDDWVHVNEDERDHYIAKVEQITGDLLVVDETIYINNSHRHVPVSKARKATAEEIAQEKRRRVFAKVGREVDEFKPGDVVKHYCINWFVSYIREDGDVAITHQCDDSWASGKELEPVYFVDNMVKEDN